jgi:exoribonuclease-2
MNVFYEEAGTFKVGVILADNTTSLQIEAPHGKRSKIKTAAVLLRFDVPVLSEFMEQTKKIADELDPDFLWECCDADVEFASSTLAANYFGHTPSSVEAAAILFLLQSAPMYFYKKGKGRYKAAPPEALKAALASQEKKRLQAILLDQHVACLSNFTLPEEFKLQLSSLLHKPDKNTLEWKALDATATKTKLSPAKILEKCGAIPSSHDYHLNQFLWENFPEGTGFGEVESTIDLNDHSDLPEAAVAAFSIDDATTTEIDDAFSVTPLKLGSFRVGIHIAAPALGITPQSQLDQLVAQRLSTVYLPGSKITMLPEAVIHHYTLSEERLCPALSLYIDVADDFTVIATESRIERVRVVANLRHETLESSFNEISLRENKTDYPFGKELHLLWAFATKLQELRGKANDINNEKVDYNFEVKDDRVSIYTRHRGSPIDKVVSELMIYVNTQWGKQLADASITGIYRSQGNGKVRMGTAASPHQGLGVAQYAWSSSPMRRYVDLINQRQLIALVRGETPPYSKQSDDLLIAIRNFEIIYSIYGGFQRAMERYWCLRWLLQESIQKTSAQVIRESMAKIEGIPLTVRVPSLPDLSPGTFIELEISHIDLLERNVNARFLQKLES